MNKLKYKICYLIATALLITSSQLPSAYAVMSLEVMPADGSNSIRFGNIDSPARANAEVRIRITSNEDEQYQLFQRLQEPFVNDRGDQLNRNVVLTSAVIGSNASGTLYINDAEELTFGDQLIYTSSPNGMSDAFTLIYDIDKDKISEAGNFFGKFIYILRPVGGGAQEEVVLNAYLESFDEDFELTIRNSDPGHVISLSSESDLDKESTLEITFNGNFSGELRIFQELEQFPGNEDARLLDEETLQFFVRGAENGETDHVQPESFKSRRTLLYKSSAREDNLVLYYVLNEDRLKGQSAGNYRGAINLVVETDRSDETHPYELEINIPPVFELGVQYPDGGVSFNELLPDSPPQTKEVIVSVKTNIGKPYEVIQNVATPMTSEQGKMIESDYFTLRSEILSGVDGQNKLDDFTPVTEGDTTVYVSDKIGSPAQFKLDYRLRPYAHMPAGQYRTAVVFSLNEI